ncbi:hypothetical protein [Frankia sp. R82]|uniref:hypothetical protein n=1 Tax=Frankia sp. R82 TaxID=2950553 RepID=UPI00204445DC|nr:hypothetical protein [Frankia sp. R82]MCM3882754.1 hypothetical protein [Frankia sp. R82]
MVRRPGEQPAGAHLAAANAGRTTDPRLAVARHAIVGGTPACRRFVNDDVLAGPGDFDDWVLRTVLNPGSPQFREARYLLDEEAGVRDAAMYHSVLAAVAGGSNTRGGISGPALGWWLVAGGWWRGGQDVDEVVDEFGIKGLVGAEDYRKPDPCVGFIAWR